MSSRGIIGVKSRSFHRRRVSARNASRFIVICSSNAAGVEVFSCRAPHKTTSSKTGARSMPFSLRRYRTLRPSESGSVSTIPAASSFSKRSARILVAIPSPEVRNSLNVRYPRTIMSRTIKSDQRSPKTSRDALSGHPDLRLDFTVTSEILDRSLAYCK